MTFAKTGHPQQEPDKMCVFIAANPDWLEPAGTLVQEKSKLTNASLCPTLLLATSHLENGPEMTHWTSHWTPDFS